jgi:DNA polymerase II small subunit/DNA polymerase delta subunit B
MDKKGILKKFFESGVLLTPRALEKIDDSNADFFHKKSQENSGPVFSLDNIEKETLKVVVKKTAQKEKITPQDLAEYYKNKYNGTKRLLLEKIRQPISIKNSARQIVDVGLIAMVRELTPTGFLIEDGTGKLEVLSKKHTVAEDDVVGLVGSIKEGGTLVEKEIIFPDVPDNNRIKKIERAKILLAEEPDVCNTNVDYIIAIRAKETTKNVITNLTNPAKISFSRGNNEIVVVVYDPQKNTTLQEATQYLVKRHLSPTMELVKDTEDHFLLDPPPDILWVLSENKWAKTYKGITVLSCGSGSALINLETREIEFID